MECATVGLELKIHPQPATLDKLAEFVRPMIAPVNKGAENNTIVYYGMFKQISDQINKKLTWLELKTKLYSRKSLS